MSAVPDRRPPVLDASGGPNPVKLWDMMEGIPQRNLLGLGDPDVHKLDGRWWMFLGGFHIGLKNNLYSASLPVGAPLSSNDWTFTTDPRNPRNALPLVPQPPKGAFDHFGLHTPSYARGIDALAPGGPVARERIYYAGRSARSTTDNDHPYAIGVLERTADGWRRHPEPILRGTPAFPSVFEPKARYIENRWRIWYAETPRETGRKTPPVYQICYVDSADGVTNWSSPKVLFATGDGYFDAVVTPVDGSYEMVVCRGSNLFGKKDFPKQGMWWLSSDKPSGDRRDWTAAPIPIFDPDEGGEHWYANGIFGPSVRYGDTAGDAGVMYVFFASVHRTVPWYRIAAHRLLTLRRPPVPAPYYFAIGRARYRRR